MDSEFSLGFAEALMDKQGVPDKELPRLFPGVVGTLAAYLFYLDKRGLKRQFRLDDMNLRTSNQPTSLMNPGMK